MFSYYNHMQQLCFDKQVNFYFAC